MSHSLLNIEKRALPRFTLRGVGLEREASLREQMAAIQRQLGEGEEGNAAEMAELSEAITKANLPKEVEEQARRELRRLQRMSEAAAEYGPPAVAAGAHRSFRS